MKKTTTLQLTVISLLCMFISFNLCAQPDCKRPVNTTSSPVINTFVNTCFDIYDSEKAIVYKIESMSNGQAGGNDAQGVLNKLDECVSGLKNIQKQAAVLIESGSGMFEAAKGLSVFEYLKAFKNITNALKVAKYSLHNAKILYENISSKSGANKTKTSSADNTVAAVIPPATVQSRTMQMVSNQAGERKISLTINKIKYSELQGIRNFLSSCTGVKNVSVKFDQQVAVVQIMHILSTEEIWKQLNLKFPLLLSDDNLTSLNEEAGTISLALK